MVKKELLVVALGGNAIVKKDKGKDLRIQYNSIQKAIKTISPLFQKYHVVLVHGNGFQIGELVLQNEIARKKVPLSPLDILDAETQGELGYLIEQAVMNELQKKSIYLPVVSLLTQVVVDKNDPAFKNPSKPIGSYYTLHEAAELTKKNYVMINDSGRGYRRVVPSPKPLKIIGIDTIKELVRNTIVIAAGGGGIPVIEKKKQLIGVEAVIDKDLTGAFLGNGIGANILLILTAVEAVYLNFNKKKKGRIMKSTVKEMKKYIKEKQFGIGSMLPKIEASIGFLENGGKKVIITSPGKAMKALKGKAGTTIVR